jgi:hypothetical protein
MRKLALLTAIIVSLAVASTAAATAPVRSHGELHNPNYTTTMNASPAHVESLGIDRSHR